MPGPVSRTPLFGSTPNSHFSIALHDAAASITPCLPYRAAAFIVITYRDKTLLNCGPANNQPSRMHGVLCEVAYRFVPQAASRRNRQVGAMPTSLKNSSEPARASATSVSLPQPTRPGYFFYLCDARRRSAMGSRRRVFPILECPAGVDRIGIALTVAYVEAKRLELMERCILHSLRSCLPKSIGVAGGFALQLPGVVPLLRRRRCDVEGIFQNERSCLMLSAKN